MDTDSIHKETFIYSWKNGKFGRINRSCEYCSGISCRKRFCAIDFNVFSKREGKSGHSPPSFSVTFGFGKKDRVKTRKRIFKSDFWQKRGKKETFPTLLFSYLWLWQKRPRQKKDTDFQMTLKNGYMACNLTFLRKCGKRGGEISLVIWTSWCGDKGVTRMIGQRHIGLSLTSFLESAGK